MMTVNRCFISDEPIDPLLDGGFGGLGGPGFGGFGGFGPSYLPQTWIGSALGAKGDLLFPIVIFVFFVVGVWTVIQLLLGFIVPLIASKLAIKGAKAGALFGKRDVTGQETTSELDFITNAVLDALNEPKCLKYVACHSGQFLNGMAGGKEQTQSYEGILKSLSTMTHSDALAIFKNAFVDGKENCSQFKCHADHENTVDVDPAHNSASHNETENSVHS
ncbi:hypothetical protein Ocin01_13463 [Orchesella cincta]|uniref:Uncharacterized protein n=1 Tax=Orchesella cincta TaxID=48709 RepID=A0A1D2MJR6_ORCCI|nr:hypothetical protein Ocin01_13463 [Orchesella cincta]